MVDMTLYHFLAETFLPPEGSFHLRSYPTATIYIHGIVQSVLKDRKRYTYGRAMGLLIGLIKRTTLLS